MNPKSGSKHHGQIKAYLYVHGGILVCLKLLVASHSNKGKIKSKEDGDTNDNGITFICSCFHIFTSDEILIINSFVCFSFIKITYVQYINQYQWE